MSATFTRWLNSTGFIAKVSFVPGPHRPQRQAAGAVVDGELPSLAYLDPVASRIHKAPEDPVFIVYSSPFLRCLWIFFLWAFFFGLNRIELLLDFLQ